MPLVEKSFSDVVSLTRNTSATYWDRHGVLQTAAPNEPRFDHDPSTLDSSIQAINLSLLTEESRVAGTTGSSLTIALEGETVYEVGTTLVLSDAADINRYISGKVTDSSVGSVTILVQNKSGASVGSDWVTIRSLGLILDASLSETAAIDDVPAFNASAGHWVIDASFDDSEPLAGMGLDWRFSGSGKMVVSYSGGTAKVWSGGQVIYTVESYTPTEPTHICEGGMATIGGLTYKPSAISDADASALATGDFQVEPFAPDELFANGEQGAWYDPSDLTTLFQDSAGITPVTADGDPVGLMLDKRLGLVRGPEQSANPGPDYASLTGFTATNGNLSIVDGHVRLTGNGGISRVTISETLTVGKTYNVMIRARSSSPGARMFFWSGVEPSIDSGVGSIGSEFSDFSCIVKATSENVDVRAYIDTSSATAGYTLDIASISIKELPGNHASQSTTAAKPTFRTDGTLHWLEFDGSNDALYTSYLTNSITDAAKSYLYCGAGAVTSGSYGPVLAEEQTNNSRRNIIQFVDTRSDPTRLFYNLTDSSNPVTIDRLIPLPLGAVSVDSVVSDSGDYSAFANSELQGTAQDSRSFASETRLSIGQQFNTYLGGNIFGIVLSSGNHPTYTRLRLEKYLAEKSGVILP